MCFIVKSHSLNFDCWAYIPSSWLKDSGRGGRLDTHLYTHKAQKHSCVSICRHVSTFNFICVSLLTAAAVEPRRALESPSKGTSDRRIHFNGLCKSHSARIKSPKKDQEQIKRRTPKTSLTIHS